MAFLTTWCEAAGRRLTRWEKILRQILYGFTAHEMFMELRKERESFHRLFMLSIFGDTIGLPILPPYYTLRLLPYVVPSLSRWKRSLLRERDLTDLASQDL
jgi:hypothetical protein